MKVCFQQYQGGYGSAVPMSYIIDRDGKIVDAWYGVRRRRAEGDGGPAKDGRRIGRGHRQDMQTPRPRKSAAAGYRRRPTALPGHPRRRLRPRLDQHQRLETFPAKDVDYTVDHNYPGWVRWVCKKFKANPITDVRLGKVFAGPDGSPTVHFELHLKDGEILQGDLPFHWDSERKQWIGWEGLDWHLHPRRRRNADGNTGV